MHRPILLQSSLCLSIDSHGSVRILALFTTQSPSSERSTSPFRPKKRVETLVASVEFEVALPANEWYLSRTKSERLFVGAYVRKAKRANVFVKSSRLLREEEVERMNHDGGACDRLFLVASLS